MMQPLPVTLLCILAISAVQCLHLPASTTSRVEIPRNSTPCSIDPSAVCSSLDASENYSVQLDASLFHESGEIKGNFFPSILILFVNSNCIVFGLAAPGY